MQGTPASSIFPMGDKDAFGRGRRYPISDNVAVCLGRCSSKSPSTDAKVNYLVIRYLYFISVRGGLDLCSPSTALKVNCLVIRHLYFRSVRGDLQEGHGCASRCQALSFRAQNRGFCALFAFGPSRYLAFASTKTAFLCVSVKSKYSTNNFQKN